YCNRCTGRRWRDDSGESGNSFLPLSETSVGTAAPAVQASAARLGFRLFILAIKSVGAGLRPAGQPRAAVPTRPRFRYAYSGQKKKGRFALPLVPIKSLPSLTAARPVPPCRRRAHLPERRRSWLTLRSGL